MAVSTVVKVLKTKLITIAGRKAGRIFGVHHTTAGYWAKKVKNENFHNQSWGGNKNFLLGENEIHFEVVLWNFLQKTSNVGILTKLNTKYLSPLF